MVSNGLLDSVKLDAGVTAHLYAHEIMLMPGPPVPCWSYVTDGLVAFRQREVVFTLRRAPGEERPPGDGIGLLEFVARSAKSGKTIDRGGFSEFGPRGFLGNPQLRGLVYTAAQPLIDVPLSPHHLTALPLFGSELEVVRRYGSMRLLARLGKVATFYPFPPWGERARKPVAGALESVLEQVGGLRLPDASLRLEGELATLRLLPPCEPVLAKMVDKMPEDKPFALYPTLAADAAACLVWSPGQQGPEAISLPGADSKSFGACFVAFVAEQKECEVRLFEDGVIVALTDRAWFELRAALGAGQPYRLPKTAGEMNFVVEWPTTVYDSPFGDRFEVPSGWLTFQPQGLRRDAEEGPVGEMQIILLASDQDLKTAIDATTLAEYIKSLRAGVKDVVSHMPEGSPRSDLVIEVKLLPDASPAFAYGTRSLGPESNLGELVPRRIERIPTPDVEREVRFQIFFPLWGGTGKIFYGGDSAVDRTPKAKRPAPPPSEEGGGGTNYPTH